MSARFNTLSIPLTEFFYGNIFYVGECLSNQSVLFFLICFLKEAEKFSSRFLLINNV